MKTVFFDLGNVLVKVHVPKLFSGLSEVSGLRVEELQKLLKSEKLQEKYERGKISTQDLYFAIHKRAKSGFSFEEFEKAFNDIFTPNEDVWKVVEALKKNQNRLILLSNTSECHFEYSKKNFPVLNFFDDFVLSYQVGAWKPDVSIFKKALSLTDSSLENCFYTDDIPEFINAASVLGIPGHIFQDAKILKKELFSRDFLND